MILLIEFMLSLVCSSLGFFMDSVSLVVELLQMSSLFEWFIGSVWLVCINFNGNVRKPIVQNKPHASRKLFKQRQKFVILEVLTLLLFLLELPANNLGTAHASK